MAESINIRVPCKPTSPRNCLEKFKRSGPPSRFLYFTSNGSWRDFSSEIVCHVKSAFLQGKPIFDMSVSDSRLLFDFIRMVQIDFHCGKRRSIAWIDESGNCFFPGLFISEEFDDAVEENDDNHDPKIEIGIRISSNGDRCLKPKRENENKEEEEVTSLRKLNEEEELKRQRLVGEIARWRNARVLNEKEKVYSTIKDQFMSGMNNVNCNVMVTAIHFCCEKSWREIFDKQLKATEEARGAANMVYVWHGASGNSMESSLSRAFRLDSKVAAAESYGVGVYLSPLGLPHASANLAEVDENGERHLIFCRVILGNVEKVEAGSQQSNSSGVNFDTGSDNPMNPKWYIVWSETMSMRIFPEFVVSFKSYNPVQSQMRELKCTKYYSFEKLFSKIRSLLPVAKIQDVAALYEGYRSGKMVRDVFIKQLRWTVGDKVLLSAIREIRGSG